MKNLATFKENIQKIDETQEMDFTISDCFKAIHCKNKFLKSFRPQIFLTFRYSLLTNAFSNMLYLKRKLSDKIMFHFK